MPFSYYAQALRKEGRPVRESCRRCGSNFVEGERVGFTAYPIGTPHSVRWSAWKVHYTRPVIVGVYEARFSCIEPQRIQLQWDGTRFLDLQGRPVAMATFLGWRGVELQ